MPTICYGACEWWARCALPTLRCSAYSIVKQPLVIVGKCRSPHERSDMRDLSRMSLRSSGLQVRPSISIPAARFCVRALHHHRPRDQRGRGEHRMLAAPASLACKRMCTLRTQATQGSRTTGVPRAMGYGLYVISSVHRAVWPPSPRVRHARLDPSVGGSGPHDFAVRVGALVCRASASIASRCQRP